MTALSLLLNPWAWLAFVGWTLGVILITDERATTHEHDKMQVAWDRANETATRARQARIDANRKLMADAQALVDKERLDHAKETDRLNRNLRGALGELRRRPARPAGLEVAGAGPAGATGPGPSGGCTGAGLYRDDAELLTWTADAAQRVRIQRDACYKLYDAAREAVSRLQCQ